MRLLTLLALACCLALSSLRAEEFLPKVQRILILGDSITYSGGYVDQFELFLWRHYPERHLEVLDLGLPSETVSGLSEPGHAGGAFPRPDLHERLDRVLAQTKPDLVLACYGMNDGIYFPPAEERLVAFRQGMQKLHAKVEATGAQIIHLTPPIFDPVPLGDKVSTDGQGLPFRGYDEVLAQFSAWLVEQRTASGWHVIDLHTPMRAALAARRVEDPSFCFARDGVHGNTAAHEVMARALIEGLGQTPDPDMTATSAVLQTIQQRRQFLSDAWLTATGHQRPGMNKGLPLPVAQAQAAQLEKTIATQLPP